MHYTGPITIIHACGHSEEYVLYDRHGRARHQDHWMQSRTCRACTAAQMDAAATAVTHDLLNLTGSPKQIDWAMRIRHHIRSQIQVTMGRAVEQAQLAGCDGDTIQERWRPVIEEIFNQTDSRYWIARRNVPAQRILVEMRNRLDAANQTR
jgi:hypothetical protein